MWSGYQVWYIGRWFDLKASFSLNRCKIVSEISVYVSVVSEVSEVFSWFCLCTEWESVWAGYQFWYIGRWFYLKAIFNLNSCTRTEERNSCTRTEGRTLGLFKFRWIDLNSYTWKAGPYFYSGKGESWGNPFDASRILKLYMAFYILNKNGISLQANTKQQKNGYFGHPNQNPILALTKSSSPSKNTPHLPLMRVNIGMAAVWCNYM